MINYLVTHTDLDGVSCAILAEYYRILGSVVNDNGDLLTTNDNGYPLEIAYCNYPDVDKKVDEIITMVTNKEIDLNHLWITDISVSKEIADKLSKLNGVDVKLFDHHETAMWLNKYDFCHVEVSRDGRQLSGTWLLFEYLRNEYPNDNRIRKNLYDFVDIVTNYDTYAWTKLGEYGRICKQYNDLFHLLGKAQFIDHMITAIDTDWEITDMGADMMLLLEINQKQIDDYISVKNNELKNDHIAQYKGYTFGWVLVDRYISEVGNKLSTKHPECDFIALIDLSKGIVSLRTVKENIHLGNDVAKEFGGGGHAKAAGFTIDENIMKKLTYKIPALVFGQS